jgi:hypothetical protein
MLDRKTRAVSRGAAFLPAALRGFALLVDFPFADRVVPPDFLLFGLAEILRAALGAEVFAFLRGATFLRELFFVFGVLFFFFGVFFLVAMNQVYHCA